jgi:hypothetical protein
MSFTEFVNQTTFNTKQNIKLVIVAVLVLLSVTIMIAGSLYRGCINKLRHVSVFAAFYGISSSITRKPITSIKHDGSCRFRGEGHNGIALAASGLVIDLRMGGNHDAVSASHPA